jgi:hypothetical protein
MNSRAGVEKLDRRLGEFSASMGIVPRGALHEKTAQESLIGL